MTFYKLRWHLKDLLLYTALQASDSSPAAGSLLPWRKPVSISASFPSRQQPDCSLTPQLVSFTSAIFILLPWSHRDKQCLPKRAIITHSARQVFFCFTGCYSYFCFPFFSFANGLLNYQQRFFFFALSACSVTFISSETDFDMEPEEEAQNHGLHSATGGEEDTHTHTL